ncbi:MAG: PilT/PilU family type 4a pilus ATPase [Acidobacteriota bacterium]
MDTGVFQRLLVNAIEKGASDVHLQVGSPPLLRVRGELAEVKYHPLSPDETAAIVEEVLSKTYRSETLEQLSDLDLSYSLEGHGRFRVNIFRQRGTFSVVLRVIPIQVGAFKDLALPPVLEQIAGIRRGLVLVTGSTGNGKSTTLAAMINHINETRRTHIVTIEDPIEFLFKHKLSVISQREVGSDTPSFRRALQAALRQDPDIIFIGEMRDRDTLEVALKAAETGHVVFSALHTQDALKTLNHLIGFFPGSQEQQVRSRLADCLMAVISLRLLPWKGTHGRIPAVEILRTTRTIQECIRDASKTQAVTRYMEEGGDIYGMQTLDQHLLKLVKEGKVELEMAKIAASNPSSLERRVQPEE